MLRGPVGSRVVCAVISASGQVEMEDNEFLTLVRSACPGLRQNGYLLDSAAVDVRPTYTSVIIPGRNWTITFTCDFRDNTVDCCVRHAGEAASSDIALIRFLIDNFQYRGSARPRVPAAETFEGKVDRLVRWYASVLKDRADPVWQDQPIGNPTSG